MKFREAIPEDAEAVQRVARQSWHEAYDGIIGEEAVEEKINEWYDIHALEESIEHEDSPMLVAADNDIIGFAQGGPSEDGPADVCLWRIYALPAYWGDGVGTTLLNKLCSILRLEGHDSIWLSVMAENSVGRAFYAKHGFETHEKQTIELAGQEVTDMILIRDL